MKYASVLLVGLIFVVGATCLNAESVYVRPHFRKNGSFVQGHWRTAPDSSRLNNWSTKGNYNSYTMKAGSVLPYRLKPIGMSPRRSGSLGLSSLQDRRCYLGGK